MRRLLLAALTITAGCTGGDDDPPRDLVDGFSVSNYGYTFDMRTGEALAELTVDVTGSGHCIELPYGIVEVGPVEIDGDGAHASVEDGVLKACGKKLEDETVTLSASFVVPEDQLASTDVGFGRFDDMNGDETSYLLSWVGECDRIGPCDPTPSAFATYQFVILHDPAQQVLCSGLVDDTVAGVTSCDFSFAGGPTYSTFGAIAGQWTQTALGEWGGVDVTLYDIPATGIAAAVQTTSFRGFFEWMSSTFGTYPYGTELRFVTANTYWNGFEHPGNILLRDGLVGAPSAYADPLSHTIFHEIAHQWAGDETTVASVRDFGLKEAMAEYLTYVWEDENEAAGIAASTAAAWKGYSSGVDYFPIPGEDPELIEFWTDVYGPGPMVFFRQLEVMFGRADVIAALQSLLGSERAISALDVRDALEATTGADLDGYFDAWITGTGVPAWPEATIAVGDAGGGSVDVTVTLTTADGVPRGCKFDVMLVGTSDSLAVAFDFGTDGVSPGTQTVTPGFGVTSTNLDPFHECLVFAPGQALTASRPAPWHR